MKGLRGQGAPTELSPTPAAEATMAKWGAHTSFPSSQLAPAQDGAEETSGQRWTCLPSTPQPMLTAVLLDTQATGGWRKGGNNS